MHREFDPAVDPFERRRAAGVLAFTLLLAALLVLDLLPLLANWLDLPTSASREIFGIRYALIAAILGGARVLFTSLDLALDGRIGADFAVTIACLAAILLGEPLVAAEVVVIGLIGECLEAITFDRTQKSLRSLTELFPMRAWVLRDGVETRVFTSQLAIDDTVIVKPGGKIPVDGIVTDGVSTVDTAALTGESLPLDKSVGDRVLAGCINQYGALTIRAEKIAKQTVAGRVIELTSKALQQKAPLERYADRLARRFLPVVLGLALLAFAVNVAFVRLTADPIPSLSATCRAAYYPALAVLVVACPCPLVLATPAAVIAALGRLAGTGVLLKSGAALERLAAVTHIAFDKTGTLTTGELELGEIVPLADISPDDLFRTAATVEQKSEHPIAKLIVTEAAHRSLSLAPLDAFEAHPGSGVSATVHGSRFLAGNRKMLESNGISAPDETCEQTVLYICKDGSLLGRIGARDTLRPEATGVIDDLKALGLSISLLSGDRAIVANTIAERAGISEVHAELLPAQKVDALQSAIRDSQSAIAFVGDGINDAPALAAASVGIAVGSGSDIAAETGDVVLMGEPLRPLPFLIRLSRMALAVMRQNIVWFGFGVNLAGVLVAGFVWPFFAPNAQWFENAPLFAVVYHQLGSLLVLLNSMRLLAFEKPISKRISTLARDADLWFNELPFDETLHALSHHWKRVLTVASFVLFLIWLISGVTKVNSNEIGVVQRFGAVRDDLSPGLHLRWPWPIEEIAVLKPAEIRTVEIGFRYLSSETGEKLRIAQAEQEKLRRPGQSADQTWSSAHAFGISRLTDESLFLTGDGNLIEVLATVRFVIVDPRTFLFQCSDAETAIRTTAESVLRELVGGGRFEELLTIERTRFEMRAFARLQQRIAALNLGLRLEGMTLHDLHPPQEVVGSYHAVAEAIQKRDRAINEAEADAIRVRRRAADDALYLVRLAEADASRKVNEASAARETFLAWHAARTSLSDTENALLQKELEELLSAGMNRAQAMLAVAEKRRKMLASRQALTDLRLTLQAVVTVLSGRDKILVDAENLPGRRTLFLADPEMFRLPSGIVKPESEPPK